jgi:hypothetical protein
VAVAGVSLLALSTVQGYHGYVLFAWLYGLCLGGFLYSLKMFTMERVRARHFTRTWGFVQSAEAIPVLLGVPITGSCSTCSAIPFQLQLELFLRPTVSRPVSLGIGPPFGILVQILSCSCFV